MYLPAVRHPDPARRSFDDVLHGLIELKRGLQGALGLVPPPSVTDSELIEEVLAAGGSVSGEPIDLAGALRLPWRLFEALVAVLHERDARRVILTPGGNDHGCDVVVLDAGGSRGNLFVQCKATARDELDSEAAVREVEGARPPYENKLDVAFQGRCLYTNAKRLGKRTRRAAEVCGVTVHDRA